MRAMAFVTSRRSWESSRFRHGTPAFRARPWSSQLPTGAPSHLSATKNGLAPGYLSSTEYSLNRIWAQTFPDGSGNLAGADRLRVPGCGRDGGPVSLAVTLGSNGAWTAAGGGASYSGTSTVSRGSYGRRVMRLTLDAASLAALETALEADASTLCEEAVTISSLTTRAVLKVNKRETRAKLSA